MLDKCSSSCCMQSRIGDGVILDLDTLEVNLYASSSGEISTQDEADDALMRLLLLEIPAEESVAC